MGLHVTCFNRAKKQSQICNDKTKTVHRLSKELSFKIDIVCLEHCQRKAQRHASWVADWREPTAPLGISPFKLPMTLMTVQSQSRQRHCQPASTWSVAVAMVTRIRTQKRQRRASTWYSDRDEGFLKWGYPKNGGLYWKSYPNGWSRVTPF